MEYEEGSKWWAPEVFPANHLDSDRDYNVKVRERCVDPNADSDYLADKLRTAAAPALAPENLTTSDLRKYRLDLLWDPGNRRACVFWAWQVMLKPFDAAWPEEDNETIAGGGHFFVYSRNITEAAFKLPLGSNSQYAARVRERCTDPAQDGEWGYLPSLWTAPPVQAERLENVTILFNWPKLLSVRFVAGPSGWLEDLAPDEPGYNSHSDCVYTGWYVEVADPSTPNDWVVQEECLAVSRDFEGAMR
ncbi:unnamed protein product [Effrenium voratum]|uniref:Uncharacterized protein n=1 Tax=Effrenium voratum TaxID=2562239 RepID=A0AA36N0H2_9DINO|nr:unnamed protein product [Effrenium voratum]